MGDWQPLLDGAEAEAAREAIAGVVAALAEIGSDDGSLIDGHAGVALLHAYRALDGDEAAAEAAADHLGRALDGLGDLPPWLSVGFSGVAWAAHHLAPLVGEVDGLDAIDDLVLAAVERPDWPFPYELMGGVTGLGLYGVARAPRPVALRIIDRVVDHLDRLAERDGDGTTWRTHGPLHLRGDQERADNASGYHMLGIAHGVTGVAGLLAEVCARGEHPLARRLLTGSLTWLLARSRPEGHPRQPRMLGRNLAPRGPVDGWCYGDPGTAVVLIRAGMATGEPSWIAAGRELAGHAARLAADGDETIGFDPSLCHGTVGRAHIFNRIGQCTGDAALLDAARASYAATLRRRGEVGIGGFVSPGAGNEGPMAGFQMGSAGVALALLAAVSPVEPDWDAALLLALPPGAAAD